MFIKLQIVDQINYSSYLNKHGNVAFENLPSNQHSALLCVTKVGSQALMSLDYFSDKFI